MADRLLALHWQIVGENRNGYTGCLRYSANSACSLTVMISMGVPASIAYASPVLVFVAPGPSVVRQTDTCERRVLFSVLDELVPAQPYLASQAAVGGCHEGSACLVAGSDHIDLRAGSKRLQEVQVFFTCRKTLEFRRVQQGIRKPLLPGTPKTYSTPSCSSASTSKLLAFFDLASVYPAYKSSVLISCPVLGVGPSPL